MPEKCKSSDVKALRPEKCVVWGGQGHPSSCTACTEDMELEKEMKGLEDLIEKIKIKRRGLRTAMNRNHDHLVHKFPPEIVSHIFIQYAPTATFFGDRSNDRSHPLYLGAVCQKWRQLAWATPELWSVLRFRFCLNGVHATNYKVLPQLVAECLERSATLPLTLDFFTQNDGDKVHSEVINILNNYSARWHDVHFDLPKHHLRRLCGSSQGNILRKLSLSGHINLTRNISNPSDTPISSMKSKPSPTHLTLTAFHLTSADISWKFITVASLHLISVDECVELLRRTPLLESLALREIQPSFATFPIPQTRISCLHLHSFELSSIREAVVTEILDSMRLPALRKWVHYHCSLPLDSMISVAASSSFRLKEFRISGVEETYEEVHNFLYHLSWLEVLQLQFWFSGQPPTEKIFRLLCTSEFLPLKCLSQLRSLEFRFDFCSSWECILPRILASPYRQSLKVKVDYTCHGCSVCVSNDTARRILELVKEGTNLTIVQDGKDVLEGLKEQLKCL